ncbi:MAG TPA: ATP-binding cassette domain-containing protein [Sedimentibacter sp.]|jgi:putative ABC transport system ATP-binding protein|nr:ABC transporter ATP-binding protein [Clostridiales bacterium]HOG62541.1 ATP-binding cassette domain-containing protein [Sedimentibacter sp.]HPY56156.1 ATP-binding cassette domain-containing protein [Sedimentibacter sp.]
MLDIINLSKTFNQGTDYEIRIFSNFNIHINKGECTAILGANGCGKSTLFNIISGFLMQEKGIIKLNGKNINGLKENERAKFIGRVHQNPSAGVSPSLTILENISLSDKKCQKFTLRKLIRKNKIEAYKEILRTLDLGLETKLDTEVKYLSGGQRQSLSLLMATMNKPQLLLLDEHTAALDPKTSRLVMEKTQELIKTQNITTMMISHNARDALMYSDRIIMLDKGEIILDLRKGQITEKELLNIYNSRNYGSPLTEAV